MFFFIFLKTCVYRFRCIFRTARYIIINFELIGSVGFPVSSAEAGVNGLMDSPFRSGLAGGLAAEQIIYDFAGISSCQREGSVNGGDRAQA